MDQYYRPDQVYHVVSHARVLHVVALPAEDHKFVAWCLEFPTMTVTADTEAEAVRRVTDTIDLTSDTDE